MKKIILFLLICTLITLCFFCLNKLKEDKIYENTKASNNSLDETIKVMEKVYLNYVEEINLNPQQYLGKTIEI